MIHTERLKRVEILLRGHAGVDEGVHAGHRRLGQGLGHLRVPA